MVPGEVELGPEVDFALRREDWSKYEILRGGGVVWVRAVLLKLNEIDLSKANLPSGVVPPVGIFAAQTTNLITAFFQPALKGKPDPSPLTPTDVATPGEDVEMTALSEPFNEYLLQGRVPKLLRTKSIATGIRIIKGRYLANGDPALQVDAQVVVSPARDARPEELGT